MNRLDYDHDMLNLIFHNNWLAQNWRWNTIDAHSAHRGRNLAILHLPVSTSLGHCSRDFAIDAYARRCRHVMTNELFYRFADIAGGGGGRSLSS